MIIIPSILTDEREVVAQQVTQILSADSDYELTRVQIDMIDGTYADNVTITPLDLPDFDFDSLELDLHLMTHEPLDFVYEAKELTDDVPIKRVIGQIERMSSQEMFVEEVKKQNWIAGLSVDLYTPLSELPEDVLEEIGVLQIMGIQAGFQGQLFVDHAFEVIAEARKLLDSVNPQAELIVDGGVKPDQLARLVELGVDGVAVGSVLWKAGSLEDGLDSLYEVLAEVEE